MTIKLSDLVNITLSVPNAEEAYKILHNVFGAEKVLEQMEKAIQVGLGDVVLKFIEPTQQESSLYKQLKSKGSGVHNLTYYVEDIEEAVKEMKEKAGIVPFFSKNGVYMMDCMEKFGFNLELSEGPLSEVPKTGYATGSDKLIGNISPILHLEPVTHDVEKVYELLHDIFGAEKVEIEFVKFLNLPFLKIIHVALGNLVIQFLEPLDKEIVPTWAALLDKNGPYVHNLSFLLHDTEELVEMVEKFKKEGISVLFTIPFNYDRWELPEKPLKNESTAYMMDTLEKLGFHLEFGELISDNLKLISRILYKDMEEFLNNK